MIHQSEQTEVMCVDEGGRKKSIDKESVYICVSKSETPTESASPSLEPQAALCLPIFAHSCVYVCTRVRGEIWQQCHLVYVLDFSIWLSRDRCVKWRLNTDRITCDK